MPEITNLTQGYNLTGMEYTEDILKFLHDETTASLNNFIKYGTTLPPGRIHEYTKTKSIAELLGLTIMEVRTLTNFIDICRLNDAVFLAEPRPTTDIYMKFLATINAAPNELPMYYETTNLDEERFYYELLKDLYKWMLAYYDYITTHGASLLNTKGIMNIVVYNGELNKVKTKLGNYVGKMSVIYQETTPIPKPPTKEELTTLITEIVEKIIKEKFPNIINPPPTQPITPDPQGPGSNEP